MMLLTATLSELLTGQQPDLLCRIGRHEHGRPSPATLTHHLLFRTRSDFHRLVANLLDMQSAAFHYSVIGRFATKLLGSGYTGGLSLNDEDPISKCGVAAPDAVAQGDADYASTLSGRSRF